MRASDIKLVGAALRLLPVKTRMPLKFGAEVLRSVQCARVCARVRRFDGREALGWGETPLSVQWVWPSELPYQDRLEALIGFSKRLAEAWVDFDAEGSALELGHRFIAEALPRELEAFNRQRMAGEEMPHLAALVCCSAYDIALHDAFGKANGVDAYRTYGEEYVSKDLASVLQPADGSGVSFEGKFASDFLDLNPPSRLPVWHLVGGLDPLDESDLTGDEPNDGYPVTLREWIKTDGLACLKIKLRGNDLEWDMERVIRVGEIGQEMGVRALTTDFNCTVEDPEYVNEVLDRLKAKYPLIWDRILYVEQPFPYDLEANPIDVRDLAARKPLFMDESAHDWRFVKFGYGLGWNGVALKTCKTQTGALLSLCWAKAHGMQLMVQDLTNPMLAQVPHARLAAHAGTIMGVESNGMQFYPEASAAEARTHPGLYRRRDGVLDLATIGGAGFGYRLDEIERTLPEAVIKRGELE